MAIDYDKVSPCIPISSSSSEAIVDAETAVRVILLNKADQVLLQKVRVPGKPDFYITPGGRLRDAAEPLLEAVRRELKEETGFAKFNVLIPAPTFSGKHVMRKGAGLIEMTEHFFIARLEDELDLISSEHQNLTAEERAVFIDQRWFNLEDLSGSSDIILPINLANFVSAALTNAPLPAIDFSDPPQFIS
jgi:8-oxo-dGTP pyrophosphatase MutT (NUDIX family)